MTHVELHDTTAMRDVSENERDMDTSDSSSYSSSDSSESSDSDSSESSDSGRYSTGGRRREVVRRKVLQPSCFEFFRPCNAGINPSVICKQVNLAAKKKKKMDVSPDSLASVAPRRLMPDFEAEACDASALNVRNDVRNNSINIRKNRMDSEDKHDGCRDPEICRRVKEKKREESPEEIEKATKKAHEEMHRAEYYVGDMTRNNSTYSADAAHSLAIKAFVAIHGMFCAQFASVSTTYYIDEQGGEVCATKRTNDE